MSGDRPARHHNLPDHVARRVAELLLDIEDVAVYRGICMECGIPTEGGCGCWLSGAYEDMPISMIQLLAQVYQERKQAHQEREAEPPRSIRRPS